MVFLDNIHYNHLIESWILPVTIEGPIPAKNPNQMWLVISDNQISELGTSMETQSCRMTCGWGTM